MSEVRFKDITNEVQTARREANPSSSWQNQINWLYLKTQGFKYVQVEKSLFEFSEHGLGQRVGVELDDGTVFWAEEKDRQPKEPNFWMPMTSALSVQHLNKLCEEGGELISAASRCLAQGIHEAHPISGKLNKRWLEEEIADVEAMIRHVKDRFRLSEAFIAERVERKFEYNKKWFYSVSEESGEFYGD